MVSDLTSSEHDETPCGDDQVRPFLLESSGIRGRLLRMGPLVDNIVSRHDYPEPLARLLAELLALTGALSSLLKYDGVFTTQMKGEGAVGLMVSDVSAQGSLRGYASYDAEALETLLAAKPTAGLQDMLGKGSISLISKIFLLEHT